MKRRLGIRGSVLLLVVVLLAVVSLLAAAALNFSNSELGAARNERSGEELLACADAGRKYMLSRFSMLEGAPAELTPVNVNLAKAGVPNCDPLPNGEVPYDTRCARSGHIRQVDVSGIVAVQSRAGGDRRALRDRTNSVGPNTLGGIPYKITVHCLDDNGRGTEVEFVVRFGL